MANKKVATQAPATLPGLGWMLGGLFLAAVLASFAWQWWRQGSAGTENAASTVVAPASGMPGVAAGTSPAPSVDPAAAMPNVTPATDAHLPVGPLPVSGEQRVWLRTAANDDDVETRIAAVNNLRDSYSLEIIDELGQILVTDPAPRVRIQAIDSLRIIAGNDMDADGRIRALLMSAANDGNRDVAHAAKSAIREIAVARGER